MIYLWLDDVRPAPAGWTHVKTVDEAKTLLLTGQVYHASLDHDLGACDTCMGEQTKQEWLANAKWQNAPNCEHFGTGYTLVCWMEETGNWPKHQPTVHSANPVGRAKMEQAIHHSFGKQRK